ncbi:DNA alkylation repair protein [Clostridium sp. Sa3CVN1]|uniref:DNA alkylation repair protein n=2 Tax=Clostridiaceae TaxID=31979 RepID=A0ABR8PYJ7_9CLOT|nr:DNA alkylation repair protein [Clostridium cibarium]
MASYMKNKFPFLGIPKPKRINLTKEFLKESKKSDKIDWVFVWKCYEKPEREYHYLAIDYINELKYLLIKEDIYIIEKLIINKSWWDTVDAISYIVAYMFLRISTVRNTILVWIDSENIWLKRIAINFQVKFKEETDVDLLSRAITHNLFTKELFIDKAIGLALKEYSKIDKEWVKRFMEEHKISATSRREAIKYMK